MRLIFALVVSFVMAGPAISQGGQDEAIRQTVQRQIDALLVDDFAQAFSFASPTIQRFFGNSQNFGAMVRQGYPMVWRPAEVRFLEQNVLPGRVLQNVMIRDRAGVFHVLEYELILAESGWQINGVRIVEAPQVGA